jgi:CDP-glycerol glycerophosphotransferase
VPRLSFVLVVHREQAYLEGCAASLLDQEFADLEVVAIDDASPDHAPALLDDLAERDPRVRVTHLPERAGLGAGRNLALEAVEGEYVWFVHTTDRVAPGALAALADELRTTSPDVLLVGAREPAFAGTAHRLWDKVFRTEHLRGLGARFGSRGYSELTVTWPALLAGERIAAWPEPAYVRSRPPNAVRDRHVEGSPVDVFDQYEAVFSFLASREGEAGEARRLLVPAMVRHELSILARLPGDDRREFFRRMAEGHRRHAGGEEPGALSTRLVARDAYGAFRLLEASLDVRRSVKRGRAAASRRRGRAVAALRRRELERHYRSRRRRPIDPDLAVFAAYWYRGYSCNPRAIYERARELVPGMRGVWVVRRDAIDGLPAGIEHVVAGTRDYYDLLARARYFVNNVNFPNHLVKRHGTVHVMTHHGTPLKRMGLDLPKTAGRGDRAALMRRCARWDYSISANVFSTLVWERAYPTRYESLEVGYPRNDALVNATDEDVARIRARLDLRPDDVAVLYAPTHREYLLEEHAPPLDLAALADGLGPDHVVLGRAHYLEETALRHEGRVRDVTAHPSIEELCLAADVLLTDYSSIMFDYAVLDRPIVIHAPDWDVYRTMRGTYFDLMAEPPGVVTRTEADVVDVFRSGAVRGPDATAARTAFRTRFCSLEDGRAAERVVRRVWFGEREVAARPEPSLAT